MISDTIIHDVCLKFNSFFELCEMTKPEIGIITGVGNQHLLTFGNIENVADGSDELIRSLLTLEINTGMSESIAKSIAEAEAEIERLKAERETLCRSLGSYSSVISNGTGCFFHGADGYEKIN